MRPITGVLIILFLATGVAIAQSSNLKMGKKALLDGDFKLAVTHLEKAAAEDSDANTLFMLGYSQYHSGELVAAIATLSKVSSLKPNEISPYYYRGKARNILATQLNSPLTNTEREKYLLASIKDFSKAIELNGDDMKYYQNRAIAYRDYGILKSQKSKFYNKEAAASAYKSCISDLQKVLETNPARRDIEDQLKIAKVYMAGLK